MNKKVRFLIVAIIVLCALAQESEARRKIVRGRKVITRTYKRPLAIPAWAIVILVAIAEVILGAVLYVLMKVGILDIPYTQKYVRAPSMPPEDLTAVQAHIPASTP